MAAIVTKATFSLKNSIPLIAKDDGKEESQGGFEKCNTHIHSAHTRGCTFKKHTYLHR